MSGCYVCRVCGSDQLRQPRNIGDGYRCAACGAAGQLPLLSADPAQASLFLLERREETMWAGYPQTLYDGSPPSEPKDKAGTSAAAAGQIRQGVSVLRGRVLTAIMGAPDGLTDDEVEAQLGMRHQTASARRRELVLLGLVRDSGERRPTRSGRSAAVWVAA